MKRIPLLLIVSVVFMLFSSNKTYPIYTKQDLTGRINPETHPEFTAVAQRYTTQNTQMRKEAYSAFKQMVNAAARDGVNLVIVSGTRNRERQIEIWSDKWNSRSGNDKEKAMDILEYSSMPGTSRHHWGTDIDLNSVDPAYFETSNGQKVYAWLQENAIQFGFFQPYIKKGDNRKSGYREEKWHWSYYPIAEQMLRAYKRMISYGDINGFPGAEVASEIGVIEQFVSGIPDLNADHGGLFSIQPNP